MSKFNNGKLLYEQLSNLDGKGQNQVVKKYIKNAKYKKNKQMHEVTRLGVTVFFTHGSYLEFLSYSKELRDKIFKDIKDNVIPSVGDTKIVINDTFGIYYKTN